MTLPRRQTSATSGTLSSSRSSAGSAGLAALRRMSSPSAMACIIPYSIQDHTFADKVLSAMRKGFGGHAEPGGVR